MVKKLTKSQAEHEARSAADAIKNMQQAFAEPLTPIGLGTLIDPEMALKQLTLNTYLNNLARLLRELYSCPPSVLALPLLFNHEEVMEYIRSSTPSPHVQKAYLTVIVRVLRALDMTPTRVQQAYDDEMKQIMAEIDAFLTAQKPTQQEIEAFEVLSNMDERMAELDDMYHKAKEGNYRRKLIKTAQLRLVAHLYSGKHIPPVRRDMGTVLILDEKAPRGTVRAIQPNLNYLIVDDIHPRFVFQQHKTDRCYGTITIDVPPSLWEVIKDWLIINPSPYFLVIMSYAAKGQYRSVERTQVTKLVADAFDLSSGGPTTLRKFYLTKRFGQGDLEERTECSKMMGHSINTAIKWYQKKMPMPAAMDKDDCND